METISIRFQEEILSKMDKLISENSFNSRTEFIREAVRDKITNLSKEELINEFLKYKGRFKKGTSKEHNFQTKETVSKKLIEELEKRFK